MRCSRNAGEWVGGAHQNWSRVRGWTRQTPAKTGKCISSMLEAEACWESSGMVRWRWLGT